MKKAAFVICTRTDSQRLPNKPFRKINGIPVIEHLIKRLQNNKLPIYVAYPKEQESSYKYLSGLDHVHLHPSDYYSDPLSRMAECAVLNKIDTVIRVSHDKIFIDEKDVAAAIDIFEKKRLDYLYGSTFIPGTGFEIMSTNALVEAARKFKDVEYIGYSVRSVTDNIFNYNPKRQRGNYRFLIDYENDLKFLDVIFSQCGNDISVNSAIKYLNENPEIKHINSQPKITVYTCALNAEAFIERCMNSVSQQVGFKDIEYILIDDYSSDKTCELMAKFCLKHKNCHWIRNGSNLGLSSSSNVALKSARGKYIMRLDADDYFIYIHALEEMLREIERTDKEIIYPHNHFGSLNIIQKGKAFHHVGGALFDKDAITHLKFTDGLMGHDSLDIFLRANGQLNIGYFTKPIFFYTQRDDSMSKTNLNERGKTKNYLIKKYRRSSRKI